MYMILLASMFIGPDVPSINRPVVYIYTDVESKNYDIARRSKMIINEIYRPMSFMTQERAFIIKNFDIVILDAYDHKMYDNNIPCIKHSKNSPRLIFPPGSFAASGSFTNTIHAHLKWEKFDKDMEAYWRSDNTNYISVPDFYCFFKNDPNCPVEPKEKNPNLIVVD